MVETPNTKTTPAEKGKEDAGKGKVSPPSKSFDELSEEEKRKLLITYGYKVGKDNERLRESNAALTKDMSNLTTRLSGVERSIRESKVDKSDPASVRAFESEEDALSRRGETEKQARANAARSVELDEREKEIADERIADIAEKYGVDAEDLKSLGTNNRVALVKYAEAVSKKEPTGDGEGDEAAKAEAEAKAKAEAEGKGFVPDSNTKSGFDESVIKDGEKLSKLPEEQQTKLLEKTLKKTG
jgi:pyruvate/2-oxoglutarate dehydrogenase complex dihydrolipoamide acyltransferase (E2) component